ncbi:MAG: glycosyltransferase family 87 protein, partial [Candidatus Binatia bacterium]
RTKDGRILAHGSQEIPSSSPFVKGGTRIFTRYPIIILAFAVLFRVILLFSNPIQEDDFYRYLWDGKVVASGLNPYGIAPSAVEERRAGTQEYQKILENDGAFAEILARVNHPWVPTIYPPLAQGVFGLTALIAPGSLWGLRIIFFVFDLGICLLIIKILSCLKLNAAWVLVYAWSPLVVKETTNSAHYDVVPTFFLVLATCLLLHKQWGSASVSLALAILGKIYPVLLTPLFLWRIKKCYGWMTALHGMLVLGVVIIAGFAPFLQVGAGLWQGVVVFAEQWQTNSFVFPVLAAFTGNRWIAHLVVIVTLGAIILLLLCRLDMRDDRSFLWGSFVTLGLLFLLSPVGDPWYFVWLTPFLCIFPSPAWILLSGLLGLYYLSFYCMYHKMAETFRWVLWLEYLPFYGMLLWEARKNLVQKVGNEA